MKKQGKKAIHLALIVSLALVPTLAGCAKNKEHEQSGSKASATSENYNPSGLPIVNDKVTLKFVTTKSAQQNKPHEKQAVVEKFEKETNVHIDWNATFQGYAEKKNLMFASGDLPDVFFGPESLYDNDIMTYGSQGILIPLEELIEKHAPNINKILIDRPDIKKAITAPDGHIYSIPTIQEEEVQEINDVLFINKKWLDELGLPLPETTEQFSAALLAFKERDPNGNGKGDEIPFSFVFGHGLLGIYSMYGSFGQLDTANHILLERDKVVFTANQPSFKEATRYFHELYKAGLMDPESFTQDKKVLFSKGKNKDAPILGAYVGWNQPNVVGPDRAEDYVALPPLKGPDGTRMWNSYQKGFFTRAGFAITSANPYPEVSMRWIDELNTEKNAIEWNWGPIDYSIKEKEDGTYEFMPTPEGMGFDEFRHSEAPGGTSARILLKETIDKIAPPEDKLQRISFWELYKPYLDDNIYPNIMFTLEDTERLSILMTDINSHVTKKQSEWIIKGNIDAEWDKYTDELRKMGVEEYIEIYQKNFDRYQAVN